MQHHYGTGGRHDRGDAPAGIWTLNPRLECRDGRRAGRGCQRESACLRVGAGPQARGSGRRPTLLSLGWWLCRPASLRASWSCPASWFGLHEVGEAAVRPQHPGYTRPRWGTSWRVHAGLGGPAGDEESAPSFGHLRILPADLSELGSGLRVDRRRALLCGPCACDGRSERRRSLVRVARPSGWDLANPYIRERMSARTLGIWVDPSGTGRCVPRAV